MFQTDKRRRYAGRGEGTRPIGGLREAKGRLLDSRWPQLVIAAVTVVTLALILNAFARPFNYRVGQRVDRDVRLKTKLVITDETETQNRRDEQAALRPLVFQHDELSIADLRNEILTLVREASQQPDYMQFDSFLKHKWELTPQVYENLRTIVPNAAAYEDFRLKLDLVWEPLLKYGILEEAALPLDQERKLDTIEIYPRGAEQPVLQHKEAVLLPKLIAPEGELAVQLSKQWPDGQDANTLFELIVPKLKGTLSFDTVRTRLSEAQARANVPPVVKELSPGYSVVLQGSEINDEQLFLLREEYDRLRAQRTWGEWFAGFSGLLFIVAALFVSIGFYLSVHEPATTARPAQVTTLCLLVFVTVSLAKLLSTDPYHAEILPVAVAALLLTVAYNRSAALVVAFGLSLLVSLTDAQPMQQFVVLMGGTSVGVLALDSVRTRTKLITVGLYAALAYGMLSVALGLLSEQSWRLIFQDAAWRFGSGLIAGFFISGSLPFIESLFGIVTDISLIEMSDTSHPLLQELVRRAPGTYNHSVTVSIIAETAANAVGCNGLMVRVGALFHDIGKMLKPHYFIENKSENERNRHDRLEPAMSTLIIIGHVKDGIDLAHQYHLPKPIVDMIQQHHGTTLVDYFYREATREAKGGSASDETVDEASFRYPGPRPQSKEVAVLMLADCVESASRALSEPTPARIEKLVRNLTMNRLLDRQLDESGLTLEEVRTIEESLTKSLTSVYHGRIKYPAANPAAS